VDHDFPSIRFREDGKPLKIDKEAPENEHKDENMLQFLLKLPILKCLWRMMLRKAHNCLSNGSGWNSVFETNRSRL
jgi:hypothetical protein